MDVLCHRIQKARKDHKCSFCGYVIPSGTDYEYQAIKGDYFYTWKSHLRCLAIAGELHMWNFCDEGVTDEDFYEIIKEKFHELQTSEDYEIPDFAGQLDFVCNKCLPK
jgi:hypothetical protein